MLLGERVYPFYDLLLLVLLFQYDRRSRPDQKGQNDDFFSWSLRTCAAFPAKTSDAACTAVTPTRCRIKMEQVIAARNKSNQHGLYLKFLGLVSNRLQLIAAALQRKLCRLRRERARLVGILSKLSFGARFTVAHESKVGVSVDHVVSEYQTAAAGAFAAAR